MVRRGNRLRVGHVAGDRTVKRPVRAILWRTLMLSQDVETTVIGVVRRTVCGDTGYVCLACQWRLGNTASTVFGTELEATMHAIARHE